MKKMLLLASVFLLLASCGPVLETIYGVNKHRTFDTKQDLVDYYNGKLGLDAQRLYFFNSDSEKDNFSVNELMKLDNVGFYGLHLNDSTKVDDTNTGDKSCIGVVDKFVLNYKSGDQYGTAKSNLHNYQTYDLYGNKLVLNDTRPTVVFVIFSNMGRLAKKDTNYIVEHIQEQNKDIDYVYICVDHYRTMKQIVQN